METNPHGQPIGEAVDDWSPPPHPPREPMRGRYVRLEPVDADRHGGPLWEHLSADDANWTYLPYGPFADEQAFRSWLTSVEGNDDPQFFALSLPVSELVLGVASFLRINPGWGSIEVGHIHFSHLLQRRRAATEAMYLMMRRAFELGYRRYEWKCDALNAKSRAAAERLGFRFEGVFRQMLIYKGRNRDTAWYSVIDKDWPALREAFGRWLNPANFDSDGMQKVSLRQLTAPRDG